MTTDKNSEEENSFTNFIVKLVKKYWLYLSIAFIIFSIFFIWFLPERMANNILELENKLRGTNATIIGGIGAFIIIIVQIYRAILLKTEIDKMQEKNDEERRSNISRHTLDQYAKAVDQLKDDNGAVRLGGIFLLEQIMNSEKKEDVKYHNIVIELLCAYIRNVRLIDDLGKFNNKDQDYLGKLVNTLKARTDSTSGLIVLGRRDKADEDNKIMYLQFICLAGSHIIGREEKYLNYDNVFLRSSYLKESFIRYVSFKKADLIGCDFSEASIINVDFEGANLERAIFEASGIIGCKFKEANLRNVNFENVILSQNIRQLIEDEVSEKKANITKERKIEIINEYNPDYPEEYALEVFLFLDQLQKAKDLKGIKLDSLIMSRIEDYYPDLFKRIQ